MSLTPTEKYNALERREEVMKEAYELLDRALTSIEYMREQLDLAQRDITDAYMRLEDWI